MYTWDDLERTLASGRDGRKKLANNTYLERRGADDIAVKYHATDVVTYHRDGTLTLDSGGWLTYTTKDRLNTWAPPFHVSSRRGIWNVWTVEDRTGVTYFDGMTLRPADPVGSFAAILASDENAAAERLIAEDKATKREISTYLRGFTADVWAPILEDAAANGTAGDCWFCAMRGVDDGIPWGDTTGDTEHLRGHLTERYYMASLVANAVTEAGYVNPAVILHHGGIDTLKRAMRRYLEARLLVGASSGRRPSARHAEHWS